MTTELVFHFFKTESTIVEFMADLAVTSSRYCVRLRIRRMPKDKELQFLIQICELSLWLHLRCRLCLLFLGDELAQVVGCPWIMRDSGGSLAQNRWQGDLGLTAVGQDDTGGGRHSTSGQ